MADAKKPKLWKRILMCVTGVALLAVSIAIFQFAALGVDPYTALVSGLDKLIPFDFGTVYMLTSVILLIFVLFTEHHYVGLATFFNLLFIGYIAEWVLKLFHNLIPEPQIWVRIIALLLGILLLCVALSFYITSSLGVSAYDAISLVIVNKWNKGKLSYMRIISDMVCVLLGTGFFFLGGGKLKELPDIIGFGTIVAVFFMGPLISFFTTHLATPLLMGRKKTPAEQ